MLKGIISFTSAFIGKQASNAVERNQYKSVDKKFTEIVNEVARNMQEDHPDILGGAIDQIFTNENILNELLIILYKKSEVNVDKIYDHLDKDTLPIFFVEEFIINLKKSLLQDKLFDSLFSEKDIFININSIEAILKDKLIDKFSYEDFLDNYRKTATNNISQVNYFGLSLSPEVKKSRKLLEDIYVVPNFRVFSLGEGQEKLLESKITDIDEFEEIEISNLDFNSLIDNIHEKKYHTVILGKPGAGKSILLKYLMYQLLNFKIDHPLTEYLPIRIELRKYLQYKRYEKLNLDNYVHQLLISEYGLTSISLENVTDILLNKKVLMLFDGLDEIFHVNDKVEIENDIENFLAIHKNSKGIVTSRNNGYEEAKMNDELFTEVEIMDFNDEKIKEYVERWYQEIEKDKEVLEKEVSSFLLLKDELDPILICNPLSLSLIVILYRNIGKLPNSKLEIYRGCTNTLVEEWDDIKELKIELKVKSKKTRIFTKLAYWQYTKLSEKQENSTPLTYRNVLHEVQDTIFNLIKVTDDEYEAEKFAKEFLEYAEKRSIYFDNNFTHKTFHEYYTALWIYQNCDAKGKFQERDKIITQYIDNPYWHIVLELLISMIDERQGDDEVINELIDVQLGDFENITGHLFLLNSLSNIKNIGYDITAKLIKQSIYLAVKNYEIDKEKVRFRNSTSSNKIFYEIVKLKNNEKYRDLIKNALHEIKESFLEDDELFLKFTIFSFELNEIDLSEEPYLSVIKKYEEVYPYVFHIGNAEKEDYLRNLIRFIDSYGTREPFAIYALWFKHSTFSLGYMYDYLIHENNYTSLEEIKKNLLLLQSKGINLEKVEESVNNEFGISFKEDFKDLVTELASDKKLKKIPRKKKKRILKEI